MEVVLRKIPSVAWPTPAQAQVALKVLSTSHAIHEQCDGRHLILIRSGLYIRRMADARLCIRARSGTAFFWHLEGEKSVQNQILGARSLPCFTSAATGLRSSGEWQFNCHARTADPGEPHQSFRERGYRHEQRSESEKRHEEEAGQILEGKARREGSQTAVQGLGHQPRANPPRRPNRCRRADSGTQSASPRDSAAPSRSACSTRRARRTSSGCASTDSRMIATPA